jgi:hypothetical protein
MTSLHLDKQPEPEIILRTEAKTLQSTMEAAPGPEAVANMLLFAVVLYVIGIWMINTCPWYVLPGGIALLGLAFVQMYRVGISCTAVFDGSAIGSAFRKQDRLAKRIVGQLSLLVTHTHAHTRTHAYVRTHAITCTLLSYIDNRANKHTRSHKLKSIKQTNKMKENSSFQTHPHTHAHTHTHFLTYSLIHSHNPSNVDVAPSADQLAH